MRLPGEPAEGAVFLASCLSRDEPRSTHASRNPGGERPNIQRPNYKTGVGERDKAMRALILRWLLAVLSLWLTSVVLGGRIELDMRRPLAPFLVSLLLGLLNALVQPLLFAFKVITFPLQLLTLGLLAAAASFVLNAVFLYAIGHRGLVQGFYVPNFFSALYAALVLSVINGVLSIVVRVKG